MVPRESRTNQDQAGDRARSSALAVALFLCEILALYFLGGVLQTSQRASDFPPGTLNPNFAPAASLQRLPRVGLARAQAIVAFRGRFQERTGGDSPFLRPADLQQISGIGPKTIADIAQWLRFDHPDAAPRAPSGDVSLSPASIEEVGPPGTVRH